MDHPHDRFRLRPETWRQPHPAHAKALGRRENPPSFQDEGNFPPPSFFPTAEATTEGGAPVNGSPAILLQRGSRGDQVQALQLQLRRLGLPVGQVDGVFGSLTEQAVRLFQGQGGLAVTGQVDDATWGLLQTSVPGPSAPLLPPAPPVGAPAPPETAGPPPASPAVASFLGMPPGFWLAVGILGVVFLSHQRPPARSFGAK